MVDDHPMLLHGLTADLHVRFPTAQLTATTSVSSLLEHNQTFSLVLLDVHLGDHTSPAANVRALTERGWPVLLYTMERNQLLLRPCFTAGAAGLVDKSSAVDDLAKAITIILRHGSYMTRELALSLRELEHLPNVQLTPREIECIRLYSSGLPLKSVANRLGIAQSTVQQHLRNAKAKYHALKRPASTKVDLYQRALEDGIISLPNVTR